MPRVLDRLGDADELVRDLVLEALDAAVQGLGHLERALAEGLVDGLRAIGNGDGNLLRFRREVLAHARNGLVDGVARNLRAVGNRARQLKRAIRQRFVEGLRAGIDRLLDPLNSAVDRVGGFTHLGDGAVVETRERSTRLLIQHLDRLLYLLDQPGAVNLNGVVEALKAFGEAAGQRGAFHFNALGDLIAALCDAVFGRGQACGENVMYFVALEDDRVGNLLHRGVHGLGETCRAGVEAVRDLEADLREALGKFVSAAAESLDDDVACRGDLGARRFRLCEEILAHAITGVVQGRVDAVGRLGEGAVDAVGDAFHVEAEILVRTADRFAQARAVGNDRVALALQLVDECTHAQLVLVIGTLESRDLVAHHGFKFRRARDRAFDTVAECRDLAADRLADTHDRIGGNAFRLCKPQRHFGHGARDETHFLRASDHCREKEEQDRGKNERREEQPEIRKVEQIHHAAGLRDVLISARVTDQHRHDDPPCGGDSGDDVGRARRTRVKHRENLSHRLAIVVRGRMRGALEAAPRGAAAWTGLLFQDRARRDRRHIDVTRRAARVVSGNLVLRGFGFRSFSADLKRFLDR